MYPKENKDYQLECIVAKINLFQTTLKVPIKFEVLDVVEAVVVEVLVEVVVVVVDVAPPVQCKVKFLIKRQVWKVKIIFEYFFCNFEYDYQYKHKQVYDQCLYFALQRLSRLPLMNMLNKILSCYMYTCNRNPR